MTPGLCLASGMTNHSNIIKKYTSKLPDNMATPPVNLAPPPDNLAPPLDTQSSFASSSNLTTCTSSSAFPVIDFSRYIIGTSRVYSSSSNDLSPDHALSDHSSPAHKSQTAYSVDNPISSVKRSQSSVSSSLRYPYFRPIHESSPVDNAYLSLRRAKHPSSQPYTENSCLHGEDSWFKPPTMTHRRIGSTVSSVSTTESCLSHG